MQTRDDITELAGRIERVRHPAFRVLGAAVLIGRPEPALVLSRSVRLCPWNGTIPGARNPSPVADVFLRGSVTCLCSGT